MNETTSTTPPPQHDDWLLPTVAAEGTGGYDPYATGSLPDPPRRRQWLTSGGLLAAGAAVGVVLAIGIGHNGSSGSTGFTPSVSAPAAQSGVQPVAPPGTFPRGDDGGGDDGGR